MTDLTFSMLDGREDRQTDRQTNRQTTLTWTIFKKPDASPEQYLTFQNNTMVWYGNIKYNNKVRCMLPLINLLDLFGSWLFCLFKRLFEFLRHNFFLICRNHIKIQLKHHHIKMLFKAQWSNGKCAQPWIKWMVFFSLAS